jgi:hypothetical protein
LEYITATGGLLRFTSIFSTPQVGNVQLVGIGDDNNGYFIGYDDTTFSILRRRAGVNNFVGQASFSEDPLNGTGPSGMTLDPQKGNVYQIQYQRLGFGEIRFGIENPDTGRIFIFHKIKYANQNIDLSVLNPNFPFQAESTNTTNSSNIVLKVPSFGVFSEGLESHSMHLVHAANNTKTNVSTEANILTIRNNDTYVGKSNFIRVSPRIFSAASDGNKPVLINFYKNATLGGSPSFADFNSNTSVIAIDTAGTTISDGIKVASFAIGKSDNFRFDVTTMNLVLAPGDTLTLSGTSSSSNDVSGSITWEERFI